jgi:hypothetical protein
MVFGLSFTPAQISYSQHERPKTDESTLFPQGRIRNRSIQPRHRAVVAIPVFTSDAFRYRDAFQFVISKTTLNDGAILSERGSSKSANRVAMNSPRPAHRCKITDSPPRVPAD